MEEGNAEAFLERADLPTDRRLAEVQRFTRMGKAARLGDGVKDPQLVPIHPSSPSSGPTEAIPRLLIGRAHTRGSLRRREKLFRLERSHTAQTGGGDCLAVSLVLDIS